MFAPSRGCRHGGENHIYAGDAYLLKGIKCTLLSTILHPHPTIIKKMKTFLEVEGKMGPIPQLVSSQYRPPQPDTNPNVRKDNATEKRKRAVPTKRFRPSAAPKYSETATCPPVTISKAPVNVKSPLVPLSIFKKQKCFFVLFFYDLVFLFPKCFLCFFGKCFYFTNGQVVYSFLS